MYRCMYIPLERELTLEGEILHLEALVGAAGAGNNRGVRDERVVNTRKWHQVSLEFGQIDVEGAVEAEAGRDGADHLRNQTVEVLEAGAGNVQLAVADIIDSLVVNQEGAVRVLNGAVSGQHGVVGLDDRRRHTRGRVDGELQLRLLPVLGCQALK